MIKYFSPTSFGLFCSDKERFFKKYIVGMPREPQTPAMAVGSAFDAYVKMYLDSVFKCGVVDGLLENSVDEKLLVEAKVSGRRCFDEYKGCGALADLVKLIGDGEGLKLEDTLEGEHRGVPVLGKPDIYWTITDLAGVRTRIVLDWKVNGYYSNWGASPKAGYVGLRGATNGAHKDSMPIMSGGFVVNGTGVLDKTWLNQLIIYGWLVGGADIIGIDQLAWRKDKMKVAQHRIVVNKEYDNKLGDELVRAWEHLMNWESGARFFDELSASDSELKCRSLMSLKDNEYIKRYQETMRKLLTR